MGWRGSWEGGPVGGRTRTQTIAWDGPTELGGGGGGHMTASLGLSSASSLVRRAQSLTVLSLPAPDAARARTHAYAYAGDPATTTCNALPSLHRPSLPLLVDGEPPGCVAGCPRCDPELETPAFAASSADVRVALRRRMWQVGVLVWPTSRPARYHLPRHRLARVRPHRQHRVDNVSSLPGMAVAYA